MKKLNVKMTTSLVVCLYVIVLFVTSWVIWYYRYHYVLAWMEESSYFSTLPDFTFLGAMFPRDVLAYVGAYLLQFYYFPAIGAVLQALMPVLVFLAGAVLVVRWCRQPKRLLWLALIPVPLMVGQQLGSLDLVAPLTWVCVSWLVALFAWVVSLFWHHPFAFPSFLRHAGWVLIASCVLLALSVYRLGYQDKESQRQAYYYTLNHLAEQQSWDDILSIVPPEVAQHNQIAKRYALLSLMEKGILPDNATKYGMTSIDDIYFKNCNEPLLRCYNAMLFKALNMPNEVIHQCYLQQIYAPFGTSFGVLRLLADTYLHLQDEALAKKYLDVLSHSTVMKAWADERRPQLEAIRHRPPRYEQLKEQFLTGEMSLEVGEMILRYPRNRKLADLFLSGTLAQHDWQGFYSAYQVIAPHLYAHGEPIPLSYQQALAHFK